MIHVYPISRKKMYLVFFVANIFLSIFRYFILPSQPTTFHVIVSIASLFGFFGLWEFILFFAKFMENRMPIAMHPNRRIVIQILGTFILASIFGDILFIASNKILHFQLPAFLQVFGYLLYFMLSIVMNLIFFGTIYFYNWKTDLVSLANMQREQTAVKYDALRNQLNPHFLFNALTSLNSLIFENQQLASDFLLQLSKVYRYVLQNKEKETVSVSTELDFIAHYIFLLKTRFAKAIEFHIDLNGEAKEKEIVPVTLQILIENAVKHNIVSMQHPLKISITADDTFLIVENSINRKVQVETSNKQGLENLKAFYQYLIDKPIEIQEISSLFTVKIPLI